MALSDLLAALSGFPAEYGRFYKTADVPPEYHWSQDKGRLGDV